MKRSDFGRNSSGRLVKTLQGNLAFVPNPLPPKIEWNADLALRLAEAAEAFGRLSQASRGVSNALVIGGINRVLAAREAQLSSRIEDIHTSVADVLLLQSGITSSDAGSVRSDTQEAANYLDALYEGLAELRNPRGLPLSLRLLCRLHATLMRGVRGHRMRPGEFRREQNYIGSNTSSGESDAIYVPPPPLEMQECLRQLENYLHSGVQNGSHVFVRAAWVHYQFEAIHPYLDGNGRTGRLLIMLLLCSELGLDEALLYPSAWFESQREDYYRLLFRVSTHGEWLAWLEFFLAGIRAQSLEALWRFGHMRELREEYLQRISSSKIAARLLEIVEALFGNPFTNAARLELDFGLSRLTANRYVNHLQDLGILSPLDERRRNRIFVAREILAIVEDDEPAGDRQ